MPRVDLGDVTKWLLDAPRIAKNQNPFFWTYLDRPADGTIMLTWQPLQRLGTQFASDGLVWAPPEQLHRQDVGNGFVSNTRSCALGDDFLTAHPKRFSKCTITRRDMVSESSI